MCEFTFSAAEKQLVDEVFCNAMDVLNESDRRLPQVENLLPLLRRGISEQRFFFNFLFLKQVLFYY